MRSLAPNIDMDRWEGQDESYSPLVKIAYFPCQTRDLAMAGS